MSTFYNPYGSLGLKSTICARSIDLNMIKPAFGEDIYWKKSKKF